MEGEDHYETYFSELLIRRTELTQKEKYNFELALTFDLMYKHHQSSVVTLPLVQADAPPGPFAVRH